MIIHVILHHLNVIYETRGGYQYPLMVSYDSGLALVGVRLQLILSCDDDQYHDEYCMDDPEIAAWQVCSHIQGRVEQCFEVLCKNVKKIGVTRHEGHKLLAAEQRFLFALP